MSVTFLVNSRGSMTGLAPLFFVCRLLELIDQPVQIGLFTDDWLPFNEIKDPSNFLNSTNLHNIHTLLELGWNIHVCMPMFHKRCFLKHTPGAVKLLAYSTSVKGPKLKHASIAWCASTFRTNQRKSVRFIYSKYCHSDSCTESSQNGNTAAVAKNWPSIFFPLKAS